MNKFVVITKTQRDLPLELRGKHLPDEWPGECKEFMTIEEAQELHPGKPLFTIEDYEHFKAGLDLGHSLIPLPKAPWWKFWAKK